MLKKLKYAFIYHPFYLSFKGGLQVALQAMKQKEMCTHISVVRIVAKIWGLILYPKCNKQIVINNPMVQQQMFDKFSPVI